MWAVFTCITKFNLKVKSDGMHTCDAVVIVMFYQFYNSGVWFKRLMLYIFSMQFQYSMQLLNLLEAFHLLGISYGKLKQTSSSALWLWWTQLLTCSTSRGLVKQWVEQIEMCYGCPFKVILTWDLTFYHICNLWLVLLHIHTDIPTVYMTAIFNSWPRSSFSQPMQS